VHFPELRNRLSYLFLNQPKRSSAQELDKLGVEFVICVPGTSREFHGRIEVGKHVDFAGWVLGGTVGLARGCEGGGNSANTLTDLTALISCFWVKVLIHLSMTV
jgi:hypothetical protein